MPMPAPADNRRIIDTSMVKAKFQTRRAVSERDTTALQKSSSTATRDICWIQNILRRIMKG